MFDRGDAVNSPVVEVSNITAAAVPFVVDAVESPVAEEASNVTAASIGCVGIDCECPANCWPENVLNVSQCV